MQVFNLNVCKQLNNLAYNSEMTITLQCLTVDAHLTVLHLKTHNISCLSVTVLIKEFRYNILKAVSFLYL